LPFPLGISQSTVSENKSVVSFVSPRVGVTELRERHHMKRQVDEMITESKIPMKTR
jgi:hypothetical protein